MMRRCDCAEYIFDHVPVADLVFLIREYVAETDIDKLNAALSRVRKYAFQHSQLESYLVIKYDNEQLKFGKFSSIDHFYYITMYCSVEMAPFLLQDSNIMDVVKNWAGENSELKNYLALLGSRLDKIMRICHACEDDYDI